MAYPAIRALLACSLTLLWPAVVLAGTTWDGGGGATTNINTATNWNDDVVPTLTGGVSSLTFATAGSTATVNTPINVLGITINRDANFTIASSGGSTLTLGSGGIGVVLSTTTARTHAISSNVILGASQTWSVGANVGIATLGVSGVISDGGAGYSLTKSGSGTLNLTAANTYSGSTVIAPGSGITNINSANGSILNSSAIRVGAGSSLSVGQNNVAPTNRIGDTSGITLAGGAMTYLGQSNVASAETVGTLTIAAGGQSSVTTTPAGTGSADLTFGSASLDSIAKTGTGSTVNFAPGSRVFLPKVTLTNGILGGWATMGMTASASKPYGFATVTNGTVAVFTAYEKVYTGSSASIAAGAWSASDNVFLDTLDNAVSLTLAASATANSLSFGNSGATNRLGTLNLGGNTLTLSSGGVLFMAPSTTANRQISNGSLTVGDGTAPAELFVTSNRGHNSSWDIISAQIIDNNGQAVALVKGGQTGANAVLLSSTTSTYSGGTYINAGRLSIVGDGSLGAASGAVRFATGAGAALGIHSSTTLSASRTFSADAGGSVVIAPLYNANVVATLAGAITGSGGFVKTATNDSSGLPINGGPLAGTLILTNAGNIYEGATSVQSGVVQVGDGATTNGSLPNRAVTLGVNGANAATLHFANPQALSFTAAISGAGDLIKSGAGTLTLGTANSHTYGTTIRAGILEVASDAALGAAYDGSLAYVLVTNMGTGYTNNSSVPVTIAAPPSGVQATGTGIAQYVTAANQLAYITLSGSGSGYVAPPAVTIGQVAGSGTNAAAFAYVKGLLTLDGGTLRTTTALSISRAVFLTANGGGIDSGGFDSTFSGVFSGVGGFTKSGSGTLTLTGQNTYTGTTTSGQGVLSVATIGNSGSAGALGTTGIIAFGIGSSTGTLRYTGAGETSGRGFNLSGTTGSGGVIESNGTGPLVFTGAVTADNGDKTLTLAGLNTGTNSIGAIGNPTSSGATSLVKAGAGRWVLTGSGNYMGSTTIEQGELVLAVNATNNSTNGALGANGNAAVTLGSLVGTGTAAVLLRQGVTVDTRQWTIPGGSQTTIIGAIDGTGTATFGSTGGAKITLGRDTSLRAATGGTLVFRNEWAQASGTNVNITVGGVGNEGTVQLGQPLAATGTVRIDRGMLSLVRRDPAFPPDTVAGSLAAATAVVVGPVGSVNAVLDVGPSSTSDAYVFGAGQSLSGIGTIRLDADTPVQVAGFFSPGNSPGIFTFDGAGTTTLSGTTFMEITGTTAGTAYDQVQFTNGGSLDYGSGRLLLDITGTYAESTTFKLFDFASTASGSFTTISASGSYGILSFVRGAGGVWTSGTTTQPTQSLEFRESSGTLVVVPEPAALALAAIGIGLGGWAALRRRK